MSKILIIEDEAAIRRVLVKILSEEDDTIFTSKELKLRERAIEDFKQGNTVSEEQQRAYKLAEKISWNGMFYRKDIAYRAIAREQK